MMKTALITALICILGASFRDGWQFNSTVSPALAADTSETRNNMQPHAWELVTENSTRQFPHGAEEATPRVEFLMKDGRPTFDSSGHGFVRRPAYEDAKVRIAALDVACFAIRGCHQ